MSNQNSIIFSTYSPSNLEDIFQEKIEFNNIKDRVEFHSIDELSNVIIHKEYGLFIEDDPDAIINLIIKINTVEKPQNWLVCKNIPTAKEFISNILNPPLFIGLDFELETSPVSQTQELYDAIKLKWHHVPIVGITNYEKEDAPDILGLRNSMRLNGDSVYLKEIIYTALPNIIRDKIAISTLQKEIKDIKDINKKLQKEIVDLRETLPKDGADFGIIGHSLAMREVYGKLQKLKNTSVRVLILGERGTGKELVAKALHDTGSALSKDKYITVAGAEISSDSNTSISKLFGHVKGAFTDAKDNREGLIQQAHTGTLFIDEIATLLEKHKSNYFEF